MTAFAAESRDFNNGGMTYEAETISQLIDVYGVKVSVYNSYTSKTIRPETDYISILFGSMGSLGTYTYYLEEKNSNGSWTVINSHTVKAMGSISTSVFVTPQNAYRFRVTTTNKYSEPIMLEVYETIYD